MWLLPPLLALVLSATSLSRNDRVWALTVIVEPPVSLRGSCTPQLAIARQLVVTTGPGLGLYRVPLHPTSFFFEFDQTLFWCIFSSKPDRKNYFQLPAQTIAGGCHGQASGPTAVGVRTA